MFQVLFLFTGWDTTATIAACGVIVYLVQAFLMLRSANAARDAAQSAEQSVWVVEESDRAWIEIEQLHFSAGAEKTEEAEELLPALLYVYTNYGRTPGVVIQRALHATVTQGTTMPMPDPAYDGVVGDLFTVPQGAKYGFGEARHLPPYPLSFTRAVAQSILNGELGLIVQGYVRYRTVTDTVYRNKFAFRYVHEAQSFTPVTEEGYASHDREEEE